MLGVVRDNVRDVLFGWHVCCVLVRPSVSLSGAWLDAAMSAGREMEYARGSCWCCFFVFLRPCVYVSASACARSCADSTRCLVCALCIRCLFLDDWCACTAAEYGNVPRGQADESGVRMHDFGSFILCTSRGRVCDDDVPADTYSHDWDEFVVDTASVCSSKMQNGSVMTSEVGA